MQSRIVYSIMLSLILLIQISLVQIVYASCKPPSETSWAVGYWLKDDCIVGAGLVL